MMRAVKDDDDIFRILWGALPKNHLEFSRYQNATRFLSKPSKASDHHDGHAGKVTQQSGYGVLRSTVLRTPCIIRWHLSGIPAVYWFHDAANFMSQSLMLGLTSSAPYGDSGTEVPAHL